MKSYGELCELLPGHQPVCGFSEVGYRANTHLGGKLFKSLAFGWECEISFLAGYLWSGWASATAKTWINVALHTGPKIRSGTGRWGWGGISGFPIWMVKTLRAAVGLELHCGNSWPACGVGCGSLHTGAPHCLCCLIVDSSWSSVGQWSILKGNVWGWGTSLGLALESMGLPFDSPAAGP